MAGEKRPRDQTIRSFMMSEGDTDPLEVAPESENAEMDAVPQEDNVSDWGFAQAGPSEGGDNPVEDENDIVDYHDKNDEELPSVDVEDDNKELNNDNNDDVALDEDDAGDESSDVVYNSDDFLDDEDDDEEDDMGNPYPMDGKGGFGQDVYAFQDETNNAYEESEDEDDRLRYDIEQALDEQKHLEKIYKERDRRVLIAWEKHNKKGNRQDDKSNAQSRSQGDQLKLQYYKLLESLSSLWDELDEKRQDAEEKIDRLTSKLDREDEKATELSEAFKKFKREIAKEARFSRTGQPIKLKRILAFEDAEAAKDREVATIRLKYITLMNQTRSLEERVKQKEELAEGLHLIDFEQLKIENQTLNEKIEERNDDLHKLRKKTTTTVQILTHIKEKLSFVIEENAQLQDKLNQYDGRVTELRDKMTKAKQARDQLRAHNGKLRQKQGFIGSDLLVGDFEMRKDDLVETEKKVATLKAKHDRLSKIVRKGKAADDAYNRLMRRSVRPNVHPRDPRRNNNATPLFRN